MLLNAFPTARLVLVGDGPLRGDAERLAEQLGLADCVEFTGITNDVAGQIARFDVFVHAAHSEGLGLVLMEAMAAEVPVVASSVGGIPEIAEDRVTAFLFKRSDPRGLSEAVGVILQDAALRRRIVAHARLAVKERFSMETMCRAYAAVYREASRMREGR